MLLTLTSMTYADDSRYTMVSEGTESGGVWIIDNATGKLTLCWDSYNNPGNIYCSKWKDLNKHVKD